MKWVVLLVFLGMLYWAFFLRTHTANISSGEVMVLSPTPEMVHSPVLVDNASLNNISYRIYGEKIPSDSHIQLIPNFTQRETGQRIADAHACDMGINGGFYTKEQLPLGWFFSEGSSAGSIVESNLVTGFFWQDILSKRWISADPPKEKETTFGLQSGPLIDVRNEPMKLISDEPARRSLLGIDKEENFYVLSVAQVDNTFSGPMLADIPTLFSLPDVQSHIAFKKLLNLDGGSASFFTRKYQSQSFVLSELTPIGSLICITFAK